MSTPCYFSQNGPATVLSLDSEGNERWQRELTNELAAPTQPKLAWADAQLFVLWLDEEAVFQTKLDSQGEIIAATTALNFAVPVESYDAVVTNEGVQIWVGGPKGEPGIYAQVDGQSPELIDELGLFPLLQVDETGNVQAVWQRQFSGPLVSVVYGGVTAADNWLDAPTEISQLRSGASSRLRGPWFAVEDGTGYLAWSVDFLAGMSAGQSLSQYVSFPLVRDTAVSAPGNFQIPYRRHQTYAPITGEIQSGQRIAFDGSQNVLAPPLEGQALVSAQAAGQEGAIALRASVEYLKRKETSQIAIYYLNEGQSNGYQLLSFSANSSLNPTLIQDATGDLLVSWLERGQTPSYSVYVAGTSPQLQHSFARLTLQDYGLFLLQTLFGMFQSVIFTPFSLVLWGSVPILILLATHWWRRGQKTWQQPSFLVPLGTAVFVYWYAKSFTLQQASDYVPFSAWIPVIPNWLGSPLSLLVPLLITLLAAYAAWRYSFGRKQESIYLLFAIYAGVDTIFVHVYLRRRFVQCRLRFFILAIFPCFTFPIGINETSRL